MSNQPLLQKLISDYPHNKNNIKISDPEKVERKLTGLISEGPDSLQVISDFDFTLTKFKDSAGERCDTCHGILDHSQLLPETFREKTRQLFSKYYPIEIDHDIELDKKIPLMIEWYTKGHEALVEIHLKKSELEEVVAKSRAYLRDRAEESLQLLNEKNVPLVLFSAGIGDLLELVLKRENVCLPNIHIISNFMVYSEESQKVIGFKEPLIHMFNKNEAATEHASFFDDLSHRRNIVLLGDSIGDIKMDEGLPEPKNVLRIGFLNDKVDERFNAFQDGFDIVLTDDQTFDFVTLLIRSILK